MTRAVAARRDPKRQGVPAPTASSLPTKVTSFPTLNIAFLKTNPSVGRFWHLARAYDVKGVGFIAVEPFRSLLTTPSSPWYIVSERRFRTVLKNGVELGAWELDEHGRLWLAAPHRLANRLQTGKLTGRAIELPIDGLLGGIKLTRAHFFKSFESGRQANDTPLSRQVQEKITGVSARSQAEYDNLLGVKSTSNIAIVARYSEEALREAQWRYGSTVFRFIDYRNKLEGGKGAVYVARRIPSTRERYHEPAPKGRQRKHNKRINLDNKPELGNDDAFVRTYYLNAKAAAAAINRDPRRKVLVRKCVALHPTARRVSRLEPIGLWEQYES